MLFLCAAATAMLAAAPPLRGYSLSETWMAGWRRIADRTGRPDPEGGVQQRFNRRQYGSYQLDLAVAEFPVGRELAWAADPMAARLWVESLDEFDLATNIQLKARTPMTSRGTLAVRFDRLDNRETRSALLRTEFELFLEPERGPYARIGAYPRFEKDDSDVELAVGYRDLRWGEASLHAWALDVFTNASFALAESRDARLPLHLWQIDPHVGFSLEAATPRISGFRGELYLGGVLPGRTRHRYPDEPAKDHELVMSAFLTGALFEWEREWFTGGVTAMWMDTRTAWTKTADERTLLERTVRTMAYGVADLPRNVRAEASVTRIDRPEWFRGAVRRDTEWLFSGAGTWMPVELAGVELRLLVDRRSAPDPVIDATNIRLVTRVVLQLGPHIWAAFGTGWDIDGDHGVYDGSGATITVDY